MAADAKLLKRTDLIRAAAKDAVTQTQTAVAYLKRTADRYEARAILDTCEAISLLAVAVESLADECDSIVRAANDRVRE